MFKKVYLFILRERERKSQAVGAAPDVGLDLTKPDIVT